MVGFKILRNEKIDIDYVENPEGLPYVDIIGRDCSSGRITSWLSINKEQLEQVVRELQKKLAAL
jgi:PP-loop superfamily ATP-utilizing enzyme